MLQQEGDCLQRRRVLFSKANATKAHKTTKQIISNCKIVKYPFVCPSGALAVSTIRQGASEWLREFTAAAKF